MTNADKYNFSDFTLSHYREILAVVLDNYNPVLFRKDLSSLKRSCIVRHDVDFSLEAAISLAKIESELGLKSTYFIHIHSEYYNALEKESSEIIHEILKLGHEIGIHFDSHYYGIEDRESLTENLELEKVLFKSYFNSAVKSFSFHNTNEWILSQDEFTYSGLINPYSSTIKNKYKYCSDSNGYWRFDRMLDFVLNNVGNNIQILTHPLWWTKNIDSPKSKILNHLESRKIRDYQNYTSTLKKYNRPNIDWN